MKKIVLVLLSLFITTLICELILLLFIQPSPKSYGLLFRKELPPINIFHENIILRLQDLEKYQGLDKYRDSHYNHIVIDGKNLTQSDMWGIMRVDHKLGYTVNENSMSTNRLWKSNNIGARSNTDTSYIKSKDSQRILFFGDSFTQGTGVAQDETFISYFNQRGNKIEAINLGVTGYSLGQSYLRFKMMKDKIEFDSVFLVFVPDCNLARDINVSRYIGFGWDGLNDLILMPRFVIESNRLTLIEKPYNLLNDIVKDNPQNVERIIVNHLRKYDAFYFKFWHENNSLIDKSILFKLLIHLHYNSTRANIIQNLLNTHGEALSITKAIIKEMVNEVDSKGAKLTLLILPTNEDIFRYSNYPEYKTAWDDMHSFLCEGQFNCYDLMEDLQRYDILIDAGYDDTHYGPRFNSIIADTILKKAIIN